MSLALEYDATKTCPTQTICPADTAVDVAVQRLLDEKFTVVAAAGNENVSVHTSSRSFTPARVPGVITVGGTMGSAPGDTDLRWNIGDPDYGAFNPGSNHGPEIDLFAPAHVVKSAHWLNNDPTAIRGKFRSGTSFSAELTSGVAATILGIPAAHAGTSAR